MRSPRSTRGALMLACVALALCTPASARWVVRFRPEHKARVVAQLQAAGYRVPLVGKYFAAVELQQRVSVEAAQAASATMGALSALARVSGVEPDLMRSFTPALRDSNQHDGSESKAPQPESAKRAAKTQADCAAKNKKLGTGDDAEALPFGISLVQGDSPKLLNDTTDYGVMVCILDTGLDPKQPDFQGLEVDGCGQDGDQNGCAMAWDGDGVGHGTHVAGTIAARKNGVGVVGVTPGNAELYIVRVFDDNSNQGVIYGSNMINAFSLCEAALSSQQNAMPDRKYRMIYSMSLGGAGPMTIERMWFSEAWKRQDLLFVAAAGNDGDVEPQYKSYPASYDEVVSVASCDCNAKRSDFSQYNDAVDITGPGSSVLSTVPTTLGYRKGGLGPQGQMGRQTMNLALPSPGTVYAPDNGGLGNVTAAVVDCGMAEKPCPPATRGAVCLAQGGGMGKDKQALYNCDRVRACMAAGAKAIILAPKDGLFDEEEYSATMDCSTSGCSCWGQLKKDLRKVPPVLAINGKNFRALRTLMGAASKAKQQLRVTVRTTMSVLATFSGTSMATPHVSGVAQRVWASYPGCSAAVMRQALEQSAKPIDGMTKGQKTDYYGYGLVQAEAAYDWLAKQPCGKQKPVLGTSKAQGDSKGLTAGSDPSA